MPVIVDTSVWVNHFKLGNPILQNLLLSDEVLTHPMIIMELACGTPPNRNQTLSDIELLASSHQASFEETRILIERAQLYGLGCGLVDLNLLASTLITPSAKLWTLDKRLQRLAIRFNVDFD